VTSAANPNGFFALIFNKSSSSDFQRHTVPGIMLFNNFQKEDAFFCKEIRFP